VPVLERHSRQRRREVDGQRATGRIATRQNRVTPRGELIATPDRGLVYGNRGCLHDAHGRIVRPYNGKLWIACRLEFNNRHRPRLMQPGRYTELFFLDEATAFAAGHRPCAECRREDYNRFTAIWQALHPDQRSASAINEQLHSERLIERRQRIHAAPFRRLPDGAFVLGEEADAPLLVLGDELLRWTPGGYTARTPRPTRGRARVITPPSLLAVLGAGWSGAMPLLHPSAGRR
jgi:hypothetical protein